MEVGNCLIILLGMGIFAYTIKRILDLVELNISVKSTKKIKKSRRIDKYNDFLEDRVV